MGWVQILTLQNDPTCISAPPVFIKYKIHCDGIGFFNVENDPTCSLAPRVVLKYKLHLDGVGFKF